MRARSRGGKYGDKIKRQTVDGFVFDSRREASRYRVLKALEGHGVIRDLRVHPRFPITIGGVEVRYPPDKLGRQGRQMVYVADFQYVDDQGQVIIEDTKMQSGHRDPVYKLKRALVFTMGYTITEV